MPRTPCKRHDTAGDLIFRPKFARRVAGDRRFCTTRIQRGEPFLRHGASLDSADSASSALNIVLVVVGDASARVEKRASVISATLAPTSRYFSADVTW